MISKEARLTRYQNKNEIKYMEKAKGCVLPNTPVAKASRPTLPPFLLGWIEPGHPGWVGSS
jgi:hypothetical protein